MHNINRHFITNFSVFSMWYHFYYTFLSTCTLKRIHLFVYNISLKILSDENTFLNGASDVTLKNFSYCLPILGERFNLDFSGTYN